jgi:hypothetical protein
VGVGGRVRSGGMGCLALSLGLFLRVTRDLRIALLLEAHSSVSALLPQFCLLVTTQGDTEADRVVQWTVQKLPPLTAE